MKAERELPRDLQEIKEELDKVAKKFSRIGTGRTSPAQTLKKADEALRNFERKFGKRLGLKVG